MAEEREHPGGNASAEPRCARCDAPMERGVILDRAHHAHGRELPWDRAALPTRFFAALPGTGPSAPREIRTYRCPRCGRLESLAP